MNPDTDENEIVRLPLWKNCLDKMRTDGISHGQVFTAEFFEKELRCQRTEMRFGLAIADIRRELETDGFYLTGRGQGGNQFVILPPSNNADVILQYNRRALDVTKRGLNLGSATRLDMLTESERRRLDGIVERTAVKCALLQRSGQVAKILSEAKPELLPGKGKP